jgi:hypothetical protein
MKNNASNPSNPLNLFSRDSLLSANAKLILQLQDRLKAKRFRPQEGDALKLAYIRVFIQSLTVQNSILKDMELDEIKKRLEALENSQSEKAGASQSHTPAFRG